MADEAVETKVLTKDELIQAIGEAYNKGEYKLMGKLSGQMAKVEADEAKTMKDERENAAKALVEKVQGIIRKALKPMYESGELNVADGVWFAWDFGDIEPSTRLTRKAAKAAGGGGTGSGGYVSRPEKSTDLLKEFGSQVMFTEDTEVTIDKVTHTMPAGTTIQQAFDFSTYGNWRFRVRMALLKEADRAK